MTDKATLLTDRGLGVGTTSSASASHRRPRPRRPVPPHERRLFDAVATRWVVDTTSAVQRVAEREGCKGRRRSTPRCRPAVEAVIIASTTHTHYGHCLAALKAKKHVFTEKPVSHKPEELREVIELAIRSETAFIVGYSGASTPTSASAGAGPQGAGRAAADQALPRDNLPPPLEYLRVSGGIFCDMLCHDFDRSSSSAARSRPRCTAWATATTRTSRRWTTSTRW